MEPASYQRALQDHLHKQCRYWLNHCAALSRLNRCLEYNCLDLKEFHDVKAFKDCGDWDLHINAAIMVPCPACGSPSRPSKLFNADLAAQHKSFRMHVYCVATPSQGSPDSFFEAQGTCHNCAFSAKASVSLADTIEPFSTWLESLAAERELFVPMKYILC